MIGFCETRASEVPWREGRPSTRASSRRRIVGPSPSTITTRDKKVVIVIIVVVAPPARTSLRLLVSGRRLATLLAFDTFPTDGASVRTTQPLLERRGGLAMRAARHNEVTHLQTTPVEPMGAVSYFQEFVISLILDISLNQRYVSFEGRVNTHIIQADRTPLVATLSGPVAILSGWEARNDTTRCIPWFNLAQGRGEVRQTLERAIEILVTLYNEGIGDCGGE